MVPGASPVGWAWTRTAVVPLSSVTGDCADVMVVAELMSGFSEYSNSTTVFALLGATVPRIKALVAVMDVAVVLTTVGGVIASGVPSISLEAAPPPAAFTARTMS